MELLNQTFGDDDSYEFYVSDGIVRRGDTAVLTAARLEPDRMVGFDLYNNFVVGISVPSLIETDPNEFTMYFDVGSRSQRFDSTHRGSSTRRFPTTGCGKRQELGRVIH